MMEIVKIKSTAEYKKLVKQFYKDDKCFRDNKSSLIDIVCGKKSKFFKLSKQEMIGVTKDGELSCICVLIYHKNDPEHLMTAFFECKKDTRAEVSFLVDYAMSFGKTLNCKRLIVSLDGHCNNSVGFLSSGEGVPSFGQSYNPMFYNTIFKNLGFDEIKLVSFKEEIAKLNLKLFKTAKRMIPQDIEFSPADFSILGFRQTMKLYTDLNNKIFQGHRYCFFRDYEEDYELFASMRPLLDGDNMIFAKRNGVPIGFLLWYPDFNELVPAKRSAGLGTFIKYRILGQAPSTIKAVQIGVLPEFENSGLILALFGEFYLYATRKHKGLTVCLSSWILEENQKSVKLSSRILPEPYKEMSAYEKDI